MKQTGEVRHTAWPIVDEAFAIAGSTGERHSGRPSARIPAHRDAGTRRRAALVLDNRPLSPRTVVRGALAGMLVVLVGLVLGWPLTAATPLAFDEALLGLVDTSGEAGDVVVARWIGHVGHLAVVTPIVIALSVAARRRTGDWNLGWLLLIVFGGATTITTVLKFVTDRPRPDDAMITTFTSAFPSGHAVRAAAVFGLVAWLIVRLSRRRSVGVAAVLVAVVVVAVNGAARVVLAAHWPTDVLVGALIGAAWLALSFALLRPSLEVDDERGPDHQEVPGS